MKIFREAVGKISRFIAIDLRSRPTQVAILCFILLYGVFYINTFHESYPDEFDNITGGWFILHGIFPYSGFFTHHGPVAYFVAAVVTLFSGASFVKFRIVYSVFLFLYFIGTFLILRKRFPNKDISFYALFLFIFGFAATYFWGHMLLADSLAAIFIAPVFTLLLLLNVTKKAPTYTDTIIIGIFTALAVLSSLTYIYLALIVYFYCLVLVAIEHKFRIFKRDVIFTGLILGAPYLLYFLYLTLTGGFAEYIAQAIDFNRKYYIYNYPRTDGSTTINPIRFAIHIAYLFFNNFTSLLVQVKDFNFLYPYNITLAVANLSMFIYLLVHRKFLFGLFFLLFLIFANARSNPLESKETDYQSAVYMVISFITLSYLLITLYKELQTIVLYHKKVIYSALFLLLGIYSIFTGLYVLNKFSQKAYTKYMGIQPLIYDRPKIAPILNNINEPDAYTWVGPFEFEEWLYVKGDLPSKYHILLPGMGKSPEIQTEMITEFEKSKPETIWFNKNTAILGNAVNDYSGFFQDYLHSYYTTLYDYRETGNEYVSVAPITPMHDIEKMLYIRKDKIDEIVSRLLEHNYIKASEIQ